MINQKVLKTLDVQQKLLEIVVQTMQNDLHMAQIKLVQGNLDIQETLHRVQFLIDSLLSTVYHQGDVDESVIDEVV